MTQTQSLQIFDEKRIRTAWDDETEKWYFSVVDVVGALTDSPNPQTYWRVLKKRLKDEGNQTVTNCNGLKMQAPDGKMRMTDVADTEQLLRIIQSIPSPKAEPFTESAGIAERGGKAARGARKVIEKELGHSIVSSKNAKSLTKGEKAISLPEE